MRKDSNRGVGCQPRGLIRFRAVGRETRKGGWLSSSRGMTPRRTRHGGKRKRKQKVYRKSNSTPLKTASAHNSSCFVTSLNCIGRPVSIVSTVNKFSAGKLEVAPGWASVSSELAILVATFLRLAVSFFFTLRAQCAKVR